MTFKQALVTVAQTDSREQIKDYFYLYSRICDFCKSSFADTEKNKLFFQLNKRLHIVESLCDEGEIAVPILKAAYPAVKDMIANSSYKKLIDCVAEALGIVVPKPVPEPPKPKEKKPVAPATVARQSTDSKSQNSQQTKTFTTPYSQKRANFPWKTVLIIAAIVLGVLAVAAGITCLVIFWNKIPWTAWQYVIGSLGGLVLTAVLSGVVFLLEDDFICSFYVLGTVVLGVIAIANWLLNLFLGANYRIIFIWLSAYEILAGCALIYFSFEEIEDEWAWGQIGEVAAVVAGLVLGLVFF